MYQYQDDSFMLHTDLYQINMAKTYYEQGIHERQTIFDLYFRKMPFDNGYAVFAGLTHIIDYLEKLRFSDSDIEYLSTLGYSDDFLNYLKTVRFTGTVRSMAEGETVFNNEPLVQVEATLAEAQLIETALLNIVNFQTLIATKANRIRQLVPKDSLMEFGTRRAHEFDAALWGARAAVIGGFDGTSNVRAAKLFGLTPSGTHAHAMVQAYGNDYDAFTAYAETHSDCVFLVDTFDTLKSGIPTAIKVANEFKGRINFKGIRIDSGDIAYLTKQARKMLDDAGYTDVQIIVSNDLDEVTILSLMSQGAKVDGWGIGTKLITAYDNPALGAVYKLAAIQDESGVWQNRMKLSGNVEKTTTPGKKKVYRIINKETGMSEGDYITLHDEVIDTDKPLLMFHPVHTVKRKLVQSFEPVELLHDVFVDGKLVYESPTVDEMQENCRRSLDTIWEETKRFLNPQEYPVDLSTDLWNMKTDFIEELSNKTLE
ncbi:nicotinate phosphoribosyltransferase [Jeotgalicoccus coquinae]|uniref:Nicotinate phosphoribosyltransferase n=1 Tax=Jeotgalicoccus coquinae TaxID=709509 RepID=A0A6V7RSM5_9STAP|nr:nicotinate phosphoribosyltransferase [Jeotgalicoccus coquinae]MBB6424159.1 nicotinate phosphoribosyltransferase [Jeotgalicoccus coquinae]GGE26033.1 nicotinate phosphoribosyltransferase [Jeotgalicoccus coquinae]CAD2081434.1 Nicotinate phosphoribosyltransferase pncB2 [Jeotgalicoccus coquinae]